LPTIEDDWESVTGFTSAEPELKKGNWVEVLEVKSDAKSDTTARTSPFTPAKKTEILGMDILIINEHFSSDDEALSVGRMDIPQIRDDVDGRILDRLSTHADVMNSAIEDVLNGGGTSEEMVGDFDELSDATKDHIMSRYSVELDTLASGLGKGMEHAAVDDNEDVDESEDVYVDERTEEGVEMLIVAGREKQAADRVGRDDDPDVSVSSSQLGNTEVALRDFKDESGSSENHEAEVFVGWNGRPELHESGISMIDSNEDLERSGGVVIDAPIEARQKYVALGVGFIGAAFLLRPKL
jgi:hypothetical protein